MQKVYIELVFLDNFMINLLILLSASLLTKSKKRWGRFAVSAGAGGAYACAVFGTSGFAVSLPVKIAVSALMCFAAYYAKGESGFWKNICAFYITSFVFAGAIFAASFSFGSPAASGGLLIIKPGVRYILMGLGTGAALTVISARVRRRTARREGSTAEIELRYRQRRAAAKAFVDTGNMLTEPFSGLYVVLITATAAAKLFDKETIALMNCKAAAVSDRLRMVPCTTALGAGIFYGVEIDSVTLKGLRGGTKAVVCAANGSLAYGCDAVIGSGLMEELMKGAGYDKVSGAEDSGVDTCAAGSGGERGLHKRQRGAAAPADAAGGGVAADAARHGRQVGQARAH